MTPFRSRRTLRAPRLPARDAARRFGRRGSDAANPARAWVPLLLRWRRRPRLAAAPSPATRVNILRIVQEFPRLSLQPTIQTGGPTIEGSRNAFANPSPRSTPVPTSTPSPSRLPRPLASAPRRIREILIKPRPILVGAPSSPRLPASRRQAPKPTVSRGAPERRPRPSPPAVALARSATNGRRWPSPAPPLLRASLAASPRARAERWGGPAIAAESRRVSSGPSEGGGPRPSGRLLAVSAPRRGEASPPIAGSRIFRTTLDRLTVTVGNRPEGPRAVAAATRPWGAGPRIAERRPEPARFVMVAHASASKVLPRLSPGPAKPMPTLSATILARRFVPDMAGAESTPRGRRSARPGSPLSKCGTAAPGFPGWPWLGRDGRGRLSHGHQRVEVVSPSLQVPSRDQRVVAPEELVWRPNSGPAAVRSSEDRPTTTDSTPTRRSSSSRSTPRTGAEGAATVPSGAPSSPSTITRIDPALLDRLADDVIRRVEQRARIDRQRRGI